MLPKHGTFWNQRGHNSFRRTLNGLRVFSSPDVIISAEDHAAFCIARRADFSQLGLAAGALEAPAVPVAVHGVKEEAVRNFAPTAGASLPRQGTGAHSRRLAAASRIHHGL